MPIEHSVVERLPIRATGALTYANQPQYIKIVNAQGFERAVLHIRSTLNQDLYAQLLGLTIEASPSVNLYSRVDVNIGRQVYVAVGSTTTQRDDYSIAPEQMMPEMTILITPITAPSSGYLDAWLSLWMKGEK